MKKLLIIGMVVCLLAGCATIQKAQGLLCNPTQAQQQAAATGVAVADSILAVLSLVPQTSQIAAMVVSLGGAKAIFGTIQGGGCVLLTQLADALNAIDQGNAAKAAVQAKMGLKAAPAGPDPLQPLRDWVR